MPHGHRRPVDRTASGGSADDVRISRFRSHRVSARSAASTLNRRLNLAQRKRRHLGAFSCGTRRRRSVPAIILRFARGDRRCFRRGRRYRHDLRLTHGLLRHDLLRARPFFATGAFAAAFFTASLLRCGLGGDLLRSSLLGGDLLRTPPWQRLSSARPSWQRPSSARPSSPPRLSSARPWPRPSSARPSWQRPSWRGLLRSGLLDRGGFLRRRLGSGLFGSGLLDCRLLRRRFLGRGSYRHRLRTHCLGNGGVNRCIVSAHLRNSLLNVPSLSCALGRSRCSGRMPGRRRWMQALEICFIGKPAGTCVNPANIPVLACLFFGFPRSRSIDRPYC